MLLVNRTLFSLLLNNFTFEGEDRGILQIQVEDDRCFTADINAKVYFTLNVQLL